MGQAKKDQEKREYEQLVARKVKAQIIGAKLCENCGDEFFTNHGELICNSCYKDLLDNA